MFQSCQIIIRELCSLLDLYYSIHNSIRICKRVVGMVRSRTKVTELFSYYLLNELLWQHIMLCGNVLWSSWLGVCRTGLQTRQPPIQSEK